MRTRVGILFWFRKNIQRPDKGGTLVCRITADKQDKDFSTGIVLPRDKWDARGQKVLGIDETAKRLNRSIVKMLDDLGDIHADLERQKRPVTAGAICRLYKNKDHSPLSLLGAYQAFLTERKPLIGIEISAATHEIGQVHCRKLAAFLSSRKMSDLRPEDFTLNMGDQFIHWLLISEGFQRNVANKYLQGTAQVLRWAIRREYISKNPLQGYEYRKVAPKDLTFLDTPELETLSDWQFASPALERVRDCFVLQCWTGLAYADLAALDVAKSAEYHQGVRVLRIRRQKSTMQKGYECVIPLLPEAERILAKYQDKVPVPSNQFYNRMLKEVGVLCGLSAEQMTTHIGRKTAGVLLLNKGLRMEVVSKVLGHSSVKQTETVYAKILDRTVVDAFAGLFGPTSPPPPAPGFEEETRVIQFRFGA